MTFVLGATLAAGVLLVVSPWLWVRVAEGLRDERRGRVERLLEEAGFAQVRGWWLGAVCVVVGAVAASIAFLLTSLVSFAAVAAFAGALAPLALLRGRRARRRRARRGLWPDVCDLLIASVRAGMSLPDAVASLARSAPDELRAAFAGFSRDIEATGRFDESAARLAVVLADAVADRIVETLRMARQVGGTELVPVLRALSSSVRADAAVRSEVEARQSWIRGAAVLGVSAPWVILTLLTLRPEGAAAYASPEGVVLVLVGGAVSVVAYRLMLALGRLPEPRRWSA